MGTNFYKDGRTKEILSNETLRKLYYSWVGIRRRANGKCFKDDDRHKRVYLNVTVANEWQDWNVYKNWALQNGYKKGLSIDRIDNSKGYNPENCRWVTRADNNRNKIKTKLYDFNGKKMTLGQIADIKGINKNILYTRVIQYGWGLEKAINVEKNHFIKEKQEKTKERNSIMIKEYTNGAAIKELAKKYNMSERNVYDCIK